MAKQTVNKYPVKKYPTVGVCGLDCGLCARYHTDGKSKCPGCCGTDFFEKHPSCGFVTCCVKQRGLETCAVCADWMECEKIYQLLEAAQLRDSFISYKPVTGNLDFIKKNGLEKFVQQETEKQKVLYQLINNFDDGRAKLFYCTACQLIPSEEVIKVIKQVSNSLKADADIKEKAKIMRTNLSKAAEVLKIDLQLRTI